MASIFVGYSGQDRPAVINIVSKIEKEFGTARVWFAPNKIKRFQNPQQTIFKAMPKIKVFLNFESKSTIGLKISDFPAGAIPTSRNEFLLYERDLAKKKNLKIINVLIDSFAVISDDFLDSTSIDLSAPLESDEGKSSIRKLISAINEIIA